MRVVNATYEYKDRQWNFRWELILFGRSHILREAATPLSSSQAIKKFEDGKTITGVARYIFWLYDHKGNPLTTRL